MTAYFTDFFDKASADAARPSTMSCGVIGDSSAMAGKQLLLNLPRALFLFVHSAFLRFALGRRAHDRKPKAHHGGQFTPALIRRKALKLQRPLARLLHRIGKSQRFRHDWPLAPIVLPSTVWLPSVAGVYLATMHHGHEMIRSLISRRAFLAASGLAVAGLSRANPGGSSRARSTILIWLSGGASHIDTWDMKPDAQPEFRGEFKPTAT